MFTYRLGKSPLDTIKDQYEDTSSDHRYYWKGNILSVNVLYPFTYSRDMPLGDPCGGHFEYTVEGLPQRLSAVTIPVSSIERAKSFYCDLLGFEAFDLYGKSLYVRRGDCTLILKLNSETGIDTGIYIGVENPFDLHRRLIDENVIFVRDPMNSPIGVYTSFKDDDGNIIHAVDMLGKVER